MSDVDDRVKVTSYMQKLWPQFDIYNNGWITWWTNVTPPVTEIHQHMSLQAVRNARGRGAIVRHPDVMAVDPLARSGHGIRLVVEIDGDVHDARLEATERRNIDYAMFGVPVVILRPGEIHREKDGAWRESIREGMA